jgi:4'-phosphopantetheinyl transferase
LVVGFWRLSQQLSPPELKNLRETEAADSAVTLQTLFWFWTLKEAYTKTLGLGLGFDFSRITFDVRNDVIYIDEAPLRGFEFVLFELDVLLGRDVGRYQGVAARRIGDEAGEGNVPSTIVRRSVVFKEQQDWIKFWDAADLVENCDILI